MNGVEDGSGKAFEAAVLRKVVQNMAYIDHGAVFPINFAMMSVAPRESEPSPVVCLLICYSISKGKQS